ncbi:ribosomal L20 [Olea europaea subsp. europaea]|uniref:Large ribosomal subunit protein bL20c n=1 Tax=Olea europaea subsp. europaea TaxID=158383 RepID=A0A8S0UFD4_OLEEU|nr:ribosomal L20 [Olea europaea subsp. europaea]
MTRIKRGYIARRRRTKIRLFASSIRGARSRLTRTITQQKIRALVSAHRDRDKQKRNFRHLWVPPQGSSTEGESRPKIRSKGVVDGQHVNISDEKRFFEDLMFIMPSIEWTGIDLIGISNQCIGSVWYLNGHQSRTEPFVNGMPILGLYL